MSKLKSKLDMFPAGFSAKNLTALFLLLIPTSFLLQVPSLLAFNACVSHLKHDSGQSCTMEVGPPALLAAFIVPLVAVLAIKFWRKLPWSDFGIVKPNFKQTLKLIALGILLIAGLDLALSLLASYWPILGQKQFEIEGPISVKGAIPMFVMLAVLAPMNEEILFRGFEFSLVGRHWGIIAGALVSSFSFGLLHGQLNVSIVTFVLGLYLCWMYYRTRSLLPGMVLHILNNTVGVFVLLTSK